MAVLARALGATAAPAGGAVTASFAAIQGQAGAEARPGAVLPGAIQSGAALPAATGLPAPAATAQPLAHAALPATMAARADAAAVPQAAVPAALQANASNAALPAAAQAGLLAPSQAQVALAADRAAMAGPLPMPATPAAPPAMAASGTTVATSLAAPAAGNPQAANPAAMPPAAMPPGAVHAEARGNPMLAGGPAHGRADGPAQAHGHTVAAAGRRSRLGGDASGHSAGIAHALALLGLGQARRRAEEETREQADRVFQRLYWLLTVTACVCAGVMALIIVLPMSGALTDATPLVRRNPLVWIGALCAVGFGAGLAAWWLDRRTR